MEKQKSIEQTIVREKLTLAQGLIQRVINAKQGAVVRENIQSNYSDSARSQYNESIYLDYYYNDASAW